MRIGLLGAGRIGAFHAGTLAAHPDVAELLVADPDPARAGEIAAPARGPGAHRGRRVRGPPGRGDDRHGHGHARRLVARAARAGVPAFCEKPLARDLAGTVAALAAVESAAEAYARTGAAGPGGGGPGGAGGRGRVEAVVA